jgi:hypothetical protein
MFSLKDTLVQIIHWTQKMFYLSPGHYSFSLLLDKIIPNVQVQFDYNIFPNSDSQLYSYSFSYEWEMNVQRITHESGFSKHHHSDSFSILSGLN